MTECKQTETETTILLDDESGHVCVDIEGDHNDKEPVDAGQLQPLIISESESIPHADDKQQPSSAPFQSAPLQHGTPTAHNACDLTHAGEDVTVSIPESLEQREKGTAAEDEVQFLVGKDCQLMVGSKSRMATLSPVFKAMFTGPLQETGDHIDIPDVEPWAFAALLRHADEDWQNFDVSMTDDSVWEILKTADKYNVEQLTDLCFTFLLQKHSRRKRSRHLCVVLEMAHHLNYTHHHEQLLHKVKRKAARVLKNQDALAELCQQCMLAIVKADDLVGVDEVLVHDAVLKWTQIECARQGRQPDSWEELRDVAGDLVQHVRYLTFPKHTLTGLRAGDPSSCLLTQSELGSLRKGHISRFPFTVQCKRGVKFEDQKKTIVCGQQVNSNCLSPLIFLAALFLLLLFAIVYIPVYLAVHGDPEMKAPTLTNVDGSHN